MSGKMTVTDYQRAGQLFVKLALEKDQPGGLQAPTDHQEIVELLASAGVEVQDYDKINFIYDSENELNLVIRRGDLIGQTLANFMKPENANKDILSRRKWRFSTGSTCARKPEYPVPKNEKCSSTELVIILWVIASKITVSEPGCPRRSIRRAGVPTPAGLQSDTHPSPTVRSRYHRPEALLPSSPSPVP